MSAGGLVLRGSRATGLYSFLIKCSSVSQEYYRRIGEEFAQRKKNFNVEPLLRESAKGNKDNETSKITEATDGYRSHRNIFLRLLLAERPS